MTYSSALQSAIETVARSLVAEYVTFGDKHQAYLTIGGQQVAVVVAAMMSPGAGLAALPKPRLRFDRGALRVNRRVHEALARAVPDGATIVWTVTAPIRVPARTAEALEDRLRLYLGEAATAAIEETIHGNKVTAGLVRHGVGEASKLAGFVHNPGPAPALLLDMTRTLILALGAAVGTRPPAGLPGERWLVLADPEGPPHIETYRAVYAQIAIPHDYDRILMVFSGGRVETLAGQAA